VSILGTKVAVSRGVRLSHAGPFSVSMSRDGGGFGLAMVGSAVMVPVADRIFAPSALCVMYGPPLTNGTGSAAGERNRGIETPHGHHGGVAVGPFPNHQVVEATLEAWLHTGCEVRRSQRAVCL
jgi:hypothetical protein